MSAGGALVAGFLLIAAVVAGVVLRLAWAKRNDPADVDVASALRPYTDCGGHVDVHPGEGRKS